MRMENMEETYEEQKKIRDIFKNFSTKRIFRFVDFLGNDNEKNMGNIQISKPKRICSFKFRIKNLLNGRYNFHYTLFITAFNNYGKKLL